jgi:hypothetical protein
VATTPRWPRSGSDPTATDAAQEMSVICHGERGVRVATLDRTATGASLSSRRERWRSEVRHHGFG